MTAEVVELGVGDRLLLAFTELGMYGIEARPALEVDPARARAELAALLAARSPHGLGSYVFWVRAEEDGQAVPPLHTSGPEVDRAVVAALAHHGLTARPAPRAGVLLVGSCPGHRRGISCPRSASGRGPVMRRSSAAIATSLMLASRRRIRPSSANSPSSVP